MNFIKCFKLIKNYTTQGPKLQIITELNLLRASEHQVNATPSMGAAAGVAPGRVGALHLFPAHEQPSKGHLCLCPSHNKILEQPQANRLLDTTEACAGASPVLSCTTHGFLGGSPMCYFKLSSIVNATQIYWTGGKVLDFWSYGTVLLF